MTADPGTGGAPPAEEMPTTGAPMQTVYDSGMSKKSKYAEEKAGLLEEGVEVSSTHSPVPVKEASSPLRLPSRVRTIVFPLMALWEGIKPYWRPVLHVLAPVCLFAVPSVLTFYITMAVTREGLSDRTAPPVWAALALAAVSVCACKRKRHAILAFLTGLFLALFMLRTAIFVRTDVDSSEFPAVETDHKRIAIVGGGPSGLGALWLLKLASPNRDVTLFESTHVVGGHSTTVYDGPDGVPLDIGFIFSTMNYELYMLLNEQYNVSRMRSTIKVAYHGDYGDYDRRHPSKYADWDNIGLNLTHAEPELLKDVYRFRDFVHMKPTLFRGLMPLSLWLWYEGFRPDFMQRVLRPLLTPLFVTAKGCVFQSAQSTINHFGKEGFLSLDLSLDPNPPLFHTVGGVATMYQQMLESLRMPADKLRMRTRVTSVRKQGAHQWLVSSNGPLGHRAELFDEVILACNARIQSELLQPRDGPMLSWLLKNIDYDQFDVRLSAATADDPVRSSPALYHVFPNAELAGSIDRILDVGPGDYKLEVWPHDTSVAPTKADRIVTTRAWEHHRFTLWELLLTKRVLPRLNHVDGLHIAGDWTMGVGQNDALKSGFRAACSAGVPRAAKLQLHQLAMQLNQTHIDDHCKL